MQVQPVHAPQVQRTSHEVPNVCMLRVFCVHCLHKSCCAVLGSGHTCGHWHTAVRKLQGRRPHGHWYNNPDKVVGGRVCSTCYTYYTGHGYPRPPKCYNRPPQVAVAGIGA